MIKGTTHLLLPIRATLDNNTYLMRIGRKGQSTVVQNHVEFLVRVLEGKASLIGTHLAPPIVAQTKRLQH